MGLVSFSNLFLKLFRYTELNTIFNTFGSKMGQTKDGVSSNGTLDRTNIATKYVRQNLNMAFPLENVGKYYESGIVVKKGAFSGKATIVGAGIYVDGYVADKIITVGIAIRDASWTTLWTIYERDYDTALGGADDARYVNFPNVPFDPDLHHFWVYAYKRDSVTAAAENFYDTDKVCVSLSLATEIVDDTEG